MECSEGDKYVTKGVNMTWPNLYVYLYNGVPPTAPPCDLTNAMNT